MKVTLESSFEEILGETSKVYSQQERKERWQQWKDLAISNGEKELVEDWIQTEACKNCIHLNQKQAWCNLQELPCTVNPILSFQDGIIGMACMGAGFQEYPTQMKMEL